MVETRYQGKARAVTIRDVARHVGVSIKTVSRAINDHPDVSAATKMVVQEAVESLGFRPSAAARGLRSGRSGMIGLLVSELLNPHYAETAHHAQSAARGAGYMLLISNTDYDRDLELAEVHMLITHGVDGLIFMTGWTDPMLADLVHRAGIPTVGLGEWPSTATVGEGGHVPLADATDSGTYAAVRYLVGLGHRHIAYITQSDAHVVAGARLRTFRRALADHGLEEQPGMVVTDPYLQTHKLEGGYQAMRRILQDGLQPTAVHTSSDLLAIGALHALHEQGLRVPADVSVVGYDDILEASFAAPPLTTLRTSAAALGQAQVALLLHRLDAARWPAPSLEVKPVLIERASTGPAPPARD